MKEFMNYEGFHKVKVSGSNAKKEAYGTLFVKDGTNVTRKYFAFPTMIKIRSV